MAYEIIPGGSTFALNRNRIRDMFTELYDATSTMAAAMAGDIVMDISPATVAPVPLATTWNRTVTVTIKDSGGDTHTWLSGTYATTVSIADTSTAGTATIASTTLTIVDGVGTILISGDAEAWLATETDTLTIADITILGVTVTGGTSVETFTAE